MRNSASTGLMMAAVACAAGLVAAVNAAPAHADDPTWTITPGGEVTGTAGTTTLKDVDTGVTLTCASSTTQATIESGSGLSGTSIATVTSAGFNSCTGPLGLSFSVTTGTVNYQLNAASYAGGVTTGTLDGITAALSGLFCSASVAGTSPTTPGSISGAYTNSSAALAVSGGDLHIWNVSGCFGLIRNGDAVSYTASYSLTPAVQITSP